MRLEQGPPAVVELRPFPAAEHGTGLGDVAIGDEGLEPLGIVPEDGAKEVVDALLDDSVVAGEVIRGQVRVFAADGIEEHGGAEGSIRPGVLVDDGEEGGEAVGGILLQTGERLHFTFGPRESFVAWWQAALEAGHLVYLEAWGVRGDPIAGLILYRHGGRLSTVHSGDDPEEREETPGAMHLLRWRAIQLAIREGSSEMDLGGVDVAGSRSEPHEGDPLYGLYQHKQSFGGQWLALTGAHERVFDPRGYQIGRLASRAARVIGR